MAGIPAAKRLKELGYTNFEIIEGSDRVGGRVQHNTLGGITAEMGHNNFLIRNESSPVNRPTVHSSIAKYISQTG